MFKRLLELITNPATGRLSTSDTTLMGAFVVSSIIMIYETYNGTLNEWEFGLFLGVFAAQRGAAKLTALRYDKGAKDDAI